LWPLGSCRKEQSGEAVAHSLTPMNTENPAQGLHLGGAHIIIPVPGCLPTWATASGRCNAAGASCFGPILPCPWPPVN